MQLTKSTRNHYTVSYDSASHWSVLTQMWGSAWPRVLPYCVLNVIVMIALTFLDQRYTKSLKIEISAQGHNFITLVVAFLLVSRVTMGLGRYNQARSAIGAMYRETRQLSHQACVFSEHDKSLMAKEWRHELLYRLLLLLRTSMAVIDYPTVGIPAWDLPEVSGMEKDNINQATFMQPEMQRWAHKPRSEWEESMRVPIRVAFLLRKTIHNQERRITPKMIPPIENKLHACVDGFMTGYYNIRTFLTTPVPFPLIQMARTFLFLYVFTIPFVLLGDPSSVYAKYFYVFVITYGYMGLEVVAIELDNPFGDDPNDFDNTAMAFTASEDTYLTILDVDGPEWADKLRLRMYDGKDDSVIPGPEQRWLLSSKSSPGIV